MDLATYLVVSEGKITPATEYVKNTMITPLIKTASLVAIGKDVKTWRNKLKGKNEKSTRSIQTIQLQACFSLCH